MATDAEWEARKIIESAMMTCGVQQCGPKGSWRAVIVVADTFYAQKNADVRRYGPPRPNPEDAEADAVAIMAAVAAGIAREVDQAWGRGVVGSHE